MPSGVSLRLHERGFLAGPPGRERMVLFAEVQGLTFAERARFDRVLAGAVTRQLTVRYAGGTLRFGHRSVDGIADPATPALLGLLDRLATIIDQRLRGGGLFAGSGWRMAADGFRPRRGARSVPMATLSRAGLYQGRVWIWRQGEERPFFSIAAGAPNARLLYEVLARRLAGRVEASAGPLGRFLFVAWGWQGRVRVHENGLAAAGFGGRRELLFAEVERMRVSAASPVRRTAVYAGPVRLGVRFLAGHASHELLIGRPAALLAGKLAEQLAAGAFEVPWADGARITKEGILAPRKGGEAELVPFAEGPRLRLTGSRCHVELPGEIRPTLTLDTAAWGFFPGLLLLERLYPAGF
jgi:hypothetical protein